MTEDPTRQGGLGREPGEGAPDQAPDLAGGAPSAADSLPPPGFYCNLEGAGLRWWNGQRWTEHRTASSEVSPATPAGLPDRKSVV